MNTHYITLTITEAQNGMMIKDICKKVLHMSGVKLRSVKFDPEGILLNGQRVFVNIRVATGDILSILVNDSSSRTDHLIPAPMNLQILYEDEDLILIDKPAGIVCHPSAGHCTDTMANGLLYYFQEKKERSSIHLIGRLDKDTSGVLTIAKNGLTADILTAQRENGQMYKTYYCLASGHFTEASGTIDIPMEEYRSADGLLRMRRGLRPAMTHYQVLQEWTDYSLLQVHIDTGRTHQIRFAMAETGHPLIGDSLYGQPSTLIGRTALHAGQIHFLHPYTGTEMAVESPLPEDFGPLLAQ